MIQASTVPLSEPSVVQTADGAVGYRSACAPVYLGPVTHVLLHGIGSGADSWLAQLRRVAAGQAGAARVLAWDAPGYGHSAHLAQERPLAADYARRMWAWLNAVGGAEAPVTLVGHSLGAMMAAAAAVQQPERVGRLVLLSPAQGYGRADAALRLQKLEDRLATLHRLGPACMAKARAAAMLSPQADATLASEVERVMARIDPRGYTQAARMLADGDIAADLARWNGPLQIASGSADTITPSAGCRALAQSRGQPCLDLGPVGHLCALEAADAVSDLLGLTPR